MSTLIRFFLVFALLGLLTACGAYTIVKAQGPVRMAGTYTVEPQIEWSRSKTGDFEYWTVDGPLIEEISFLNGIADGEPLIPTDFFPSDEQEDYPTFRSTMTAPEIQDLYEATLSKANANRISLKGLRPVDIGGQAGFRFDFSFVTQDGLERQGMALGFVHDEELFLISYSAAAVHYFGQYRDIVERVMASITLI